ncbi:hypothetical protein F8M41_001237 [Gigaspora margarita]|uniref:Uncharacterized protein n=1 Tax=Gigaspora margarita TaxID=4874 RepID=A0A8H3XEP4_GIGMA|nr:hypothetical protein F8M41_001237 [Gigaspora margarita]
MAENERECSQLHEYLFTMNKGLEEKDSVQSKGGPESSSKKVTSSESKKQYQHEQQLSNKRRHICGRSVAVAANHCLDS